jgi:hypothetical protein
MLEEWHRISNPILSRLRLEKSYLVSSLKSRTLLNTARESITAEKQNKDNNISELVEQRKRLEKDVSLKRKAVVDVKKDFQKIAKEKKKIDLPVSADIENILNRYNITAAAYHGGKLNGVDCRELLRLSKEIFPLFEAQLLAVSHPERCSSNLIIDVCNVHSDICVTLDTIASKIHMKHQEPQQEDYCILEKALTNLDYLWKTANLSYTPKIHSVLVHAMEQMKRCQGIGDMLEDDVEHVHQMAARIEARTSRMTNKAQQPLIHSKIEAVQNSQQIKGKIEMSQQNAKRIFKKRNPEADSFIKNAKLKSERDQIREETLKLIEMKPHSILDPIKFKSK